MKAGVWPVPADRTSPQLVVAWGAGEPAPGRRNDRRWSLALWNREGERHARTLWVLHSLVRSSPIPIVAASGGSAVRLADVTRDGHDDDLVGIANGNHGSEIVAVYATIGGQVRRIYGHDRILDKQGVAVVGRQIAETWWGAERGFLWFDEPRGGTSVCCPEHRVRYSLRWTGRGWREVARRRTELPA